MLWMIEKSAEVVYDEKSHQLVAAAGGEYIASISALPNDDLRIWLA